MKISKEIKKIKQKLIPLLNDYLGEKPDYLSIGIEFLDHENIWQVVPVYEISGRGHPEYIDFRTPNGIILHGQGINLTSAIRNLLYNINLFQLLRN